MMTKKRLLWLVLIPILAAIAVTSAFLFIKSGNDRRAYGFDYAAAAARVSENTDVLYVALEKDNPPYSYQDGADPYGYDAELAMVLGEKLGYNISIRTTWKGADFAGLEDGSCDLVLGAAYSEQMTERFRYSLPVCSDSYVFFGPGGEDRIADTRQLYDKNIAVLSFSEAAEGRVLPLEQLGNWSACATADAAFTAMQEGKIDLLLVTRITGLQVLESSGYDAEILSDDIAAAPRYILTRPEDTELGNAVDNALRALEEDGTLDALTAHWLCRYQHRSAFERIWDDYRVALPALAAFILLVILLNIALAHRQQRNAAIARLERNGLSGMLNLQGFCTHAGQEIRKHPEKHYVVGRMDIDHFKLYNDAFSSEAGDRIIAGLGRLLPDRQEEMGVLFFAHISGDYFVMLTEQERLDPQRDYEVIMEVLQELDPGYTFAVHMGYCPVADETMDLSIACDRAFLAQRSVHNDYERRWAWYDESMRRSLMEERDLSNEMLQALEEGQFFPWFQPQYDYATGSIVGAEALARWQHPKKGLLTPAKFIPAFEKNGFVFELDQYIWRATCAAIHRWKMQGLHLPPISVNLSRRDIYHRNLHQTLLSIVREAGLTPADLRLEITETAYTENPEQLYATIKALSETGFYLEMDDFGNGYSSLTALKSMPINLIKLDMAFLEGENSEKSGSVLSSVVHMAHLIDLPVIAEGVETAEQAEYLKSLGCRYQQGYFFSKPLSEQDFEALLRSERGVEPLRFGTQSGRSVDVLDPAWQGALLFSTFADAAAILDYSENRASILRANDRFYQVIGSPEEDWAVNENILTALPEQQSKTFRAMLEQAVQSEGEADCEVHYHPISGQTRQWVHSRVRYLGKKVTSHVLYLSVQNLTALRENEDQRRLREAEYRAAVRMSMDMVCRYRQSDRALMVTEETAASYDSVTYMQDAPEEFLCRGYIAEDSKERWLSLFRAIDEGQDSGSVNDIGIATLHGGEIRRYNAGFTTIRSTEGKIISAILSFHMLSGAQDNRALEQAQRLVQAKQEEISRQLYGINQLAAAIRTGTWWISFNADGNMESVRWGSSVRSLLGFREEREFPDTVDAWLNRLHPEDRDRVQADFQTILKNPESKYEVRYRLLTRAGEWRWFFSTGRADRREDGSIRMFYGLVVDMTREIQLKRQLDEEQHHYRGVLSALRTGTWYIEGEELSALHADEAICRILDIPESTDPETLFIYWRERVSPEDRLLVDQDIKKVQNGEMIERTLRWNHPELGYIYLRYAGFRDRQYTGPGMRVAGSIQNVDRMVREEQDSLRAMQKQLQNFRQAEYDGHRDILTGLLNRQDLYACLRNEYHPVMAVFMLDIDDFRDYNGLYGHHAGDEALRKVGAALRRFGELNQIDFYRYGGAQLLGLSYDNRIPNMTLAREMVELVRNLKISRDDAPAGCLTVSVGYTADGRNPDRMPDKADAALSRAKEAGKNRASA